MTTDQGIRPGSVPSAILGNDRECLHATLAKYCPGGQLDRDTSELGARAAVALAVQGPPRPVLHYSDYRAGLSGQR